MFGGSGHNLYVGDRKKLTGAIDWYQGISRKVESAFAPDPICDADQLAPVGQTGKSEKRPRAVLLIVTQWPSGTMAMKFGSAMKSALRVAGEEMILVQMEPERIFRAVMM
jgi:hypothetical protein